MIDLLARNIDVGSRIASAHRRGDVAEMRVGRVLELFPESDELLVEWVHSSAPGGYIPQRPTKVRAGRAVVLA